MFDFGAEGEDEDLVVIEEFIHMNVICDVKPDFDILESIQKRTIVSSFAKLKAELMNKRTLLALKIP